MEPGCSVRSACGFAFGRDGRFFLASAVGPNGEGDNLIVAFASGDHARSIRFASDLGLSPLDLAVAPNGNIVVSSEHGTLYCVAQDEVVAFDFASGKFLGTAVRFPRLHGQALAVFP